MYDSILHFIVAVKYENSFWEIFTLDNYVVMCHTITIVTFETYEETTIWL